MRGILGKSARVDYTPNSATGDEMRLAQMTLTSPGNANHTDAQ
jgi:peptide/nickel transport system substrate-binding protein